MDDLERALTRIRKVDLSAFPNVLIFEKPMDAGLWALWILQEKFGFFDQHFTTDVLEQVLLRCGTSFYAKEIERSFTRAARNLHKTVDVSGRSMFMITEKGKQHLRKFQDAENIEIIFVEGEKHRTAFRKFSEIIEKTKGKIMLVDKFYSRKSLDTLEEFGKKREIEFLTAKMSSGENPNKFKKELARFKKEFKKISIRIYSKEYELHDRYVLSGDTLILLGRGIQDIGEKESFVIVIKGKVGEDLRKTLISKFNERWTKSSNLK